MSSNYHGKRWKPIQAGKGRTKVRAPQRWEMIGLALLLGLVVGFIGGITLNLAAPKSRIVVVEKQLPVGVNGVEAKKATGERQRVAAALERYQMSGGSDEELAALYTQFRNRGWDIPEEIEDAFEKKITNPNRLVD